jgi:DNA end-binding protein Ku
MLILNTLRYPDELRPMKELDLPQARAASKPELQMALRLVEEMTHDFDPKLYHDTYREDVMTRVKAKIKAGETEVITEPEAAPSAPRGAEVIDLMALLKRSVEQRGRGDAASNRKVTHANGKKASRTRARAPAAEKRAATPHRKRA